MSEITCKNCSERYFAPICNRLGLIDFEEYDTPDDDGQTYADHCIYWKQGDPDTLEQRYAKLEQVAKNLFRYTDGVLNKNWAFSLPSDTDVFRKALENLGVDLD